MKLKEEIEHLGHYLPDQGPIQVFIHHNTLHGFEGKPFFKALEEAARFYGANYLMPLEFYLGEFSKNRIQATDLEWAISHLKGRWTVDGFIAETKKLAQDPDRKGTPFSASFQSRIDHYEKRTGKSFLAELQNLLVPFFSAYLDQGIAHWPMEFGEKSLWSAFKEYCELNVLGTLKLVHKNFGTRNSEQTLTKLLKEEDSHETLKNWLFLLPGWAGMIHVFERKPHIIPYVSRKPTLFDCAAVIAATVETLLRNDPATVQDSKHSTLSDSEKLRHQIKTIWHLAYEKNYMDASVAEFNRPVTKLKPLRPKYQMLFCIDDREESIRRNIEEVSDEIETFGVAGFFGIDMCFQALTSVDALDYCPPVVTPKARVREVIKPGREKSLPLIKYFRASLRHLSYVTRTSVLGALWNVFFGITSLIPLAFRVHFPRFSYLLRTKSSEIVFGKTETEFQFTDMLGLTHEEIATRIYNLLTTAGFKDYFAENIMIVAHGSVNQNNPHLSAYNCGACGGKKGDPNSRVFALAANTPEVRKALAEKGMKIPASTRFIPGYHDTCSDEIQFFDLTPREHAAVDELNPILRKARLKNAVERCRRFEAAPKNGSPEDCLRHVESRSQSLAEPRPELGHATNALCFIGKRSTTLGKFFDRRAFVISYDHDLDPNTQFLSGLVNAILPVCSGISLEYFFSRIDNERYGCGTKLPHNVQSLLGVSNGTVGDLRTGLPLQMIEIHEPVRLLMSIEATEEQIETLRKKVPKFAEYVDLGWILFSRIDPETRNTRIQWN